MNDKRSDAPARDGQPVAEDTASDESSHAPAAGVPEFSARRLTWQLRLDLTLRLLMLIAVAVAAAVAVWLSTDASLAISAAVLAVVLSWLAVSTLSAKVTRELPRISAMIELDASEAEASIATNLGRRPLMRWVRLMLYHRLAVLRHAQHRYAEAAAVCQAVLGYPLGPARDSRPHLLLMLAESRLQLDDLHGAYPPLLELYHTRLSLNESLQRLALQTRYEVMAGRYEQALRETPRKIEMAELMPAVQCGALHALLATAADHARQTDLARWLWSRAELICDPAQLKRMVSHGFGGNVVEATQGRGES